MDLMRSMIEMRNVSSQRRIAVTGLRPGVFERLQDGLVAALCGAMIPRVASRGGPAVRTSDQQLETTLGVGDFYQRVRSGAGRVATPEGQRRFGLALLEGSRTR
jgi:hypothetical protein